MKHKNAAFSVGAPKAANGTEIKQNPVSAFHYNGQMRKSKTKNYLFNPFNERKMKNGEQKGNRNQNQAHSGH